MEVDISQKVIFLPEDNFLYCLISNKINLYLEIVDHYIGFYIDCILTKTKFILLYPTYDNYIYNLSRSSSQGKIMNKSLQIKMKNILGVSKRNKVDLLSSTKDFFLESYFKLQFYFKIIQKLKLPNFVFLPSHLSLPVLYEEKTELNKLKENHLCSDSRINNNIFNIDDSLLTDKSILISNDCVTCREEERIGNSVRMSYFKKYRIYIVNLIEKIYVNGLEYDRLYSKDHDFNCQFINKSLERFINMLFNIE